MDILSVFHVLLGMAEKAINAPPNFKEIIESIYDGIAGKRAAILNVIGLTKKEFTDDITQPGSEAQRQFNTMITLLIAYQVAMLEYFQLSEAILEQKKAYEAAIQYILDSMEIMARSRQNWEQGMLDDEQRRMIDLMKLYQKQLEDSRNHMDTLSQRHAEISSKLLSTANTINNITMEKTEKITNVLIESSQKQIQAFDNLTSNLNKSLNESMELRNKAEAEIARSDLTGQQRDELTTEVARYTEKIEKIEHAKELVEKQKQSVVDQTQIMQQRLDEAKVLKEQAAASGDSKEMLDVVLKMTLGAEKDVIKSGEMAEASTNLVAVLSELGLDQTLTSDFEAAMATNQQTLQQHLGAIEDTYDSVLQSSFREFETLLGQQKELKKELDSTAKEVEQLQHGVKVLRIDVKTYDRNNQNTPPPPPSNDSHPRV